MVANCDDGDYISVFDFDKMKKKSKNRLVIIAHGSLALFNSVFRKIRTNIF